MSNATREDGVWIYVKPGLRSSTEITVVGEADTDSITRMMSFVSTLDEIEACTRRHTGAPVHVDARGNGPVLVQALRERGIIAFERQR